MHAFLFWQKIFIYLSKARLTISLTNHKCFIPMWLTLAIKGPRSGLIRTSWDAKRTAVLEGGEDKANPSSILDKDFLNIRRPLSPWVPSVILTWCHAFSSRSFSLETRWQKAFKSRGERTTVESSHNSLLLHGLGWGRSWGEGSKYEENLIFKAQLTLEEKTLLKVMWNPSLLINRT